MNNILKLSVLLLALSGCSTIVEGPHQTIDIDTNPAGASCKFSNNGNNVGEVVTPGSLRVEKTKYDLVISCRKSGYETATYYNHSGVDGVTLGNLVLGGVIGWGIDSATGSDNKYTDQVHLTLQRK